MADTLLAPPARRPASAAPAAGPSLPTRILATWQGRVGGGVVALVALMAVLAPWITPHDPTAVDYMAIMQAPSASHPFGTDEVGRDILSRIILGARTSLVVVVGATAMSAAAGSAIGLIAGWLGGWTDRIVMRVMDAMLAFPLIVLALAIIAILGPSLSNAITAIAIVKIPHFARLMRGEVLVLRHLDYVRAVETMGMSTTRILWRHVLPNAAGPGTGLYVHRRLAGPDDRGVAQLPWPRHPAAGAELGRHGLGRHAELAFLVDERLARPFIFVTVLAFNLLGDALRDALDRRLS
jgi:ABC-type dipeptide/oligopeptide/nickel transport systems, permease components